MREVARRLKTRGAYATYAKMLESGGGEALKDGLLEKRGDGLLQRWKKKRCVLTEEGVLLLPPKQHDPHPHHHSHHPHLHPQPPGDTGRVKQLHFANIRTVDCVERKGKYVYFTVVTTEGREVDFRSPQEAGWSAEITLQMVQYKNRQAVLAVRSTRQKQQLLAGPGAGGPGHGKTPPGHGKPLTVHGKTPRGATPGVA